MQGEMWRRVKEGQKVFVGCELLLGEKFGELHKEVRGWWKEDRI